MVNRQAVISRGLIGREYMNATGQGYPRVAPVSAPGLRYFPETGHTLRGEFRNFWERRGGLAAFGYPLSEEVVQQLDDGRNYIVQYFERARFELVGRNVRLGRVVVFAGFSGALCTAQRFCAPCGAHPNICFFDMF